MPMRQAIRTTPWRCRFKYRGTDFVERLVSIAANIFLRIRHQAFCAIAAVTILVTVSTAEAADPACSRFDVTIKTERMRKAEVTQFEKEFHEALRQVCGWWGPTFKGPFTVTVEDSRGPSMALVPAWHGNHGTLLFRTGRTLNGRSPIVHELTHVFAPNANRFLAEGLAVYAEEHLSDRIAYPAFGKDIHDAAKEFAATTDLEDLEAIVTPRQLQIEGRTEQREGYTVAGSFVRFLIDTEGLEKFRALYVKTPMVPGERIEGDANRWQEVYGLSLDALTERWRKFIADRK